MNPSNYSFISFPFLGVEVNPPRTLTIGPLSAYYYGLIIAVGLILSIGYACRRSREFGLTEDNVLDGALWVTPFAIAQPIAAGRRCRRPIAAATVRSGSARRW